MTFSGGETMVENDGVTVITYASESLTANVVTGGPDGTLMGNALDAGGNTIIADSTIEIYDTAGSTLLYTFNAGDTIQHVAGSFEREYYQGETRYHQAGDERYHKVGDNKYHELGDEKYHKVGDNKYHEIGDEKYHKVGDKFYHVEGDTKYHVEGDTKYQLGGQNIFHKVGDKEYVIDGDAQFHQAGNIVFQKQGDIKYYDIDDDETHKIGDQMRFERTADLDVNGSESHGGSAFVYRYDGSNVSRVELEVTSDTIADGDKFGEQVTIAGNRAFVYSETKETVYVFDVNSGNEIDKITGLAGVDSLTAYSSGSDIKLAVADENYDSNRGQVQVFSSSNGYNSVDLNLEGANAGDRFGTGVAFHTNSGTIDAAKNGFIEVAVASGSSDTSGTNTGKIEIYNSNAANQAAALLSTADGDTFFSHSSTQNLLDAVDFNDRFIAAGDATNNVTVWDRETGDLKFKNEVSSIGKGGVRIEGTDLYIADDTSTIIGEYDLLTLPEYSKLKPTLLVDETGFGLSSFLGEKLTTISVTDNLTNNSDFDTIAGSAFNEKATGIDKVAMDTAMTNFNVMKSKYSEIIDRLRSEASDAIEEKDDLVIQNVDDAQLVNNVLDTVYSQSGINEIISIMNPFDLNAVSSLLP